MSEYEKAYSEEDLLLQVSEAVFSILNRDGNTQADLARSLGVTQSHVSRLLNGSRNMTLKTIAQLALALDQKAQVRFEPAMPVVHFRLVDSVIKKGQSNSLPLAA